MSERAALRVVQWTTGEAAHAGFGPSNHMSSNVVVDVAVTGWVDSVGRSDDTLVRTGGWRIAKRAWL